MTNREAVKVLKSLIECLSTDCDNDCERCHIQLDDINIMLEACAVAITELSQIDDDTVSRKAVLNAIMSETKHYPSWYEERIKALPPSPSRPKEPQWIPCSDPSEIPKDKMLWVTHDNGYERYVEALFWDMTEWSDKVSDVVAYMPYYEPEPYKGVDA